MSTQGDVGVLNIQAETLITPILVPAMYEITVGLSMATTSSTSTTSQFASGLRDVLF